MQNRGPQKTENIWQMVRHVDLSKLVKPTQLVYMNYEEPLLDMNDQMHRGTFTPGKRGHPGTRVQSASSSRVRNGIPFINSSRQAPTSSRLLLSTELRLIIIYE